MSLDHCIITKYDLSDKEKAVKKSFFSKNDKINVGNNNCKSNDKPFKCISNYINIDNDEIISKYIDFDLIKNQDKIQNSIQNIHRPSENNTIPLNLIYSQNKILERNVDILHETQRSLHDLIAYNMKSQEKNSNDPTKKSYKQDTNKFTHLIEHYITPLYKSVEEMKISINNINVNVKKNQIDESSSNTNLPLLNNKYEEMIKNHKNFKEFSAKFSKNVEKNPMMDNYVKKAIEDLKTSVKEINNDMNKIENNFSENLKKIIERDNKLCLMQNKSTHNEKNFNKQEEKYYLDYKNELLEINHQKEEIINHLLFTNSKIIVPNISRPLEKINFSYKLDFDDQDFKDEKVINNSNNKSLNNTKMALSSDYITDIDINPNKKEKNIFLNNLNKSNQMTYKILHSENLSKNSNFQNENCYITKCQKRPSQKNNQIIINQVGDTKNNHPIYLKDNSLDKQVVNIHDKMNEIKEKINLNNKIKEKDLSINSPNNQNNNFSTKNSTINKSTEPSSNKYLRCTSNIIFKEEEKSTKKISIIEEKHEEKNIEKNEDILKNQIKIMIDDIEHKRNVKREITMIEKSGINCINNNMIENIILKMCVEKIITEKSKKLNSIEEKVAENKELNISKIPYQYKQNDVKTITENLVRDMIGNIIKNRNNNNKWKDTSNQADNNELAVMKNNILKEENTINNKMIDQHQQFNRIDDLIERFAEIEKSLASKVTYPSPKITQERYINSDIDLDNIINKITDKIKSNMQININVNESKKSVPSEFKLISHSLKIDGLPNINNCKTDPQREQSNQLKDVSSYTHPFEDTNKVDYEEMNKEILLPHVINLEDYELSSSCITNTQRTSPFKKRNEIETDESLSEGQIPNSKTNGDNTINSKIVSLDKNNLNDMDLIKTFNQELEVDLQNEDRDDDEYEENNIESNTKRSYDNSNKEESEDSSTNSLNVRNYMLNINNNEGLKTLNLYDSEEHKIFQRRFGNVEEIQSSQNSSKKNTGYKFFKSAGYLESGRIHNPTLFSFQNVLSNRTEKSNSVTSLHPYVGQQLDTNNKVISNHTISGSGSGSESRGPNTNSLKFSKINQYDIEDLKERQNSLNDKLKFISRNVNSLEQGDIEKKEDFRTIPENFSDLEVTIQNELKFPGGHTDQNKKMYKTDESSLNNSSI